MANPGAQLSSASDSLPVGVSERYWVYLVAVLLVTAGRLAYLAVYPYSLYADEAQYWTWAQALDWGYYSKPPFVAWAIALSTSLCGNGEGCVKLTSPLAYAVASLFVYATVQRLYADQSLSFWAGLSFLLLPGVTLSSSLISTDPFLLMFWAGAVYAVLGAVENQRLSWWLLTGLMAGLALMSKYNAALFGLSVLLLLVQRGQLRSVLVSPGIWLGGVLAMLLFLPNVGWNFAHDFVSFSHTQDVSRLDRVWLHPEHLLEFIGAQAGIIGPLLFFPLLWVVWLDVRGLLDPRLRQLMAFVWPMLLLMLLISLISRAHGNWAAPIYVTAAPVVVIWLWQRGWKGVIYASFVLHLVVAGAYYQYDRIIHVTGIELSRKADPFYRVRGWRTLGDEVKRTHRYYPHTIILTDRRKMSANMLYNLRDYPHWLVQWNGSGVIKDHYAMTTTMEGREGQSFVLISPAPANPEILADFAHAELIRQINIAMPHGRKRDFVMYYLHDFQGY